MLLLLRPFAGALTVSLALFVLAPRAPADCSLTSIGVAPLPDRGYELYKGFPGGLYVGFSNNPPPAHFASAQEIALNQIKPLDADGSVDKENGKIVLISIGMSNTRQEFVGFQARADADPGKNRQLIIVNGAQGGQPATQWTDPSSHTWSEVHTRLANAGVNANQVQVLWMKQANASPPNNFPGHAERLQMHLEEIMRSAKLHFPHLKTAYVSSRTRSYSAGSPDSTLNPEPQAFESGFSVKWMIEKQITGNSLLNFDPAKGDVVAPQILWGPYLWADGTAGRSDGFIWLCSDLANDFTHPSATGVQKVADQLLAFFKTDPTATPWFLRKTVIGQPPNVSASASITGGHALLDVSFSASADDPDGSITSYQWTFDDGTFSNAQNPVKRFAAPGAYNARLTVTDNSGNTVQRTIPINVTLGYAEWKSIHFTAAEQSNENVSGDLADVEGDGLSNVKEYAFGLNPKQADGGELLGAAPSPDQHLTFTFPQAKAAADVSVTVEAASDLAGPWSSGPTVTSQQVIADNGVVQAIRATDLTPMSSTAQRFMRLRVERIGGPSPATFQTTTTPPPPPRKRLRKIR